MHLFVGGRNANMIPSSTEHRSEYGAILQWMATGHDARKYIMPGAYDTWGSIHVQQNKAYYTFHNRTCLSLSMPLLS